jgi:hypothetical protein
MSDLIERLRGACKGHPAALIPWPHRILHEAADEIERLTAELDAHIRESANMLAKAESARESCTLVPTKKLRKMQAEIATLKAELAALRAQEPVGYGLFDAEGVCHSIGKHPSSMTIDGKHFKSVRLFAELDAAREGEKK